MHTGATLLALAAAAQSACAASGPHPNAGSTAMTEIHPTPRDVVRSLYEESLNMGDHAILERIIAPEYAGPRGDTGPAAFGRTVDELHTALPDIHYTVEDLVAEGDRVAIRWTWTGTHRGAFRGLAPSGRRISNQGFAIFQVRDGRIVRSWVETDRLGFLQQAGAVPPELTARIQPGAAAPR